MTTSIATPVEDRKSIERRIQDLLVRMTLEEKIGQMNQLSAEGADPSGSLGDDLRAGRIGSVLNQVDVSTVNELQRIAMEESRLGIPLLVGRDVIHGFRTVLPIPLGLAATWNPDLAREGARVAAPAPPAPGRSSMRRACARCRGSADLPDCAWPPCRPAKPLPRWSRDTRFVVQ